jgi:hypothetical protein
MRARAFNKRIEIWGTTSVPNGFGGNLASNDTLITTSWAKLETFTVSKRGGNATDFGLIDLNNAINITLRKREDLTIDTKNNYIKYRGDKYIINTAAVNVNFKDNLIKFVATKEIDLT